MNDLSARQVQFRLERLSPDIKASYEQAKLHALETVKYALVCGRKLNEAKELVRHGEFGRFMVETLEVHPSTANRYMKLASEWPRIEQEMGADKAAMLTFTEGMAKATKSPPKGGKSRTVTNIPPSEEIEDAVATEEETDVWLDTERTEITEPGAGEGRDEAEDQPPGEPEDSAGGSDRGHADSAQPVLAVTASTGRPPVEQIDAAIRPVKELAASYNKRSPSEKLRLEVERGLDIVFGALDSWRKL